MDQQLNRFDWFVIAEEMIWRCPMFSSVNPVRASPLLTNSFRTYTLDVNGFGREITLQALRLLQEIDIGATESVITMAHSDEVVRVGRIR